MALRNAACGSELATPRWPRLRNLVLHSNPMQPQLDVLQALLGVEWKTLTHLDLGTDDNALGLESVQILATASMTQLPGLRSLNIAGAIIHEDQFQAFLAGSWNKLEKIGIGGCDMTMAGMEAFAAGLYGNRLPGLKKLDISQVRISVLGIETIVMCLCPQLEEI